MIDLGKAALEQADRMIIDLQKLENSADDPFAAEMLKQSVSELEQIRHSLSVMLQVYDVLEGLLFPPLEKSEVMAPYNVQFHRQSLN